MTMHPSADDPGSKPRASDEPADVGMNKETRCNTVALDLDAVRTIAKASRSAPGSPDPQPKAESPSEPVRKEPSPTARERPSAPAKVIVQPSLTREQTAKPERSPTEKAAVAAASAPASSVRVQSANDVAPTQANAGGRAVLFVACACLALLLVLTWRLVVAPVGATAAHEAQGASQPRSEPSAPPTPTSALPASVTAAPSTDSTAEAPSLEESTKPTVPVVSSSGAVSAPSLLSTPAPRTSPSTPTITIPYQ